MNIRRGLFRALLFLSVLWWGGFVAFALQRAGMGDAYAHADAQSLMAVGGVIYFIGFGVVWTLFGFFDNGRPRT